MSKDHKSQISNGISTLFISKKCSKTMNRFSMKTNSKTVLLLILTMVSIGFGYNICYPPEQDDNLQSRILFLLCFSIVLLLIFLSILHFRCNSLIKNNILLKQRGEKRKFVIRQQKERWEKTFNAIPDIITLQNKNRVIIKANKAAIDFFKINGKDLIGQYCYKMFHGSSGPCSGCPASVTLSTSLFSSQPIFHKELGKSFLVSSASILDSNKEIKYLIHIAKDITVQKQLEEELQQSQKMEAIGTLAGGIAHDFNNILSVIIGYSEIAKINIQTDSGRPVEDIDQILAAGRRATELVKQILTFSQKSEQQIQAISPHLIVQEALTMMRASLPASIVIQQDIDTKCGQILADPTKVHQIVVNLYTNALHAMADKKGVLNISLIQKNLLNGQAKEHNVSSGSFIVLSVSDTGHGMSPETIARIFEPYFTTKEMGKGTGLGLAVILGIVKNYQGFVEVESEQGKSSSFKVYFPTVTDDIIETQPLDKDKALPTGTERILLVDDEETLVDINKTELESLGYAVTSTTNSMEALAKIEENPSQFDMLITDQIMPDLSGSELAQKTLLRQPDIPIILLTGYSSNITENEAIAIGIKRYVRKPVTRALLSQIVREVFDE
jgi:signal transduction histidine kinase